MTAVRTPARPQVRLQVPPHRHERRRRRRVRPAGRRRLPRLPRLPRVAVLGVLAGVMVLAGLLTWLLYFSPVLAVRSVEVAGSQDVSAAAVREVAGIPAGLPLLRLDTDAVTERLRALPQIESVTVARSWPSTVLIEVIERAPVAVVDSEGAQWLIDRHGVLFAQVTEPPAGVPPLEVERAAADDRATMAALEVIGALPADVLARVARVSATTPDSVVLHLVSGRTVIWGSAEDSERKALVLEGVFGQPGRTIDVSSPTAVVIR